jgi:hypothetical protein
MQKDNNDLVMITLDRPRYLWCGHRAMKTITALTGKNIAELDTEKVSMADLEIIMYALLLRDARENGEDLRLEQMEDLLDCVQFGELTAKMTAAFEAAFDAVKPELTAGGGEKNGTPAAGTGTKA